MGSFEIPARANGDGRAAVEFLDLRFRSQKLHWYLSTPREVRTNRSAMRWRQQTESNRKSAEYPSRNTRIRPRSFYCTMTNGTQKNTSKKDPQPKKEVV
jgi:hypothetical protein